MFKSCMTAKSKKQIKIDHLYKKKKIEIQKSHIHRVVRSSCVFNFCNVLAKDLIFYLKLRSPYIFTPKYRAYSLLRDNAGFLHSQSCTMVNFDLDKVRLVYLNLDFLISHNH